MKVIFWAVFIIALLALGPLLTIWSLNVLFPALAIPYSLETWFAVIVLGGLFNVRKSK